MLIRLVQLPYPSSKAFRWRSAQSGRLTVFLYPREKPPTPLPFWEKFVFLGAIQ
jgi:hypothetical protein